MFAIIRTRWQTRPLSPRAKRRSSAAPGSLRKKYAGIAYPPNMVRLPNHSTTSGDPRKPVLDALRAEFVRSAPPGRAALYDAKVEELRRTVPIEKTLKTDDHAPDFTL